MKTIKYSQIVDAVKKMCIDAAIELPDDVLACIKQAHEDETFPRAKGILGQIIKNAESAVADRIPICQDTGSAVYFAEMGNDVKIEGGMLCDAINEGTRRGYVDGNLRGSIVADPVFDRKNTNDNTPAGIHIDPVAGDKLKITLLPKGGGCENMSALAMLKPSDGLPGIMKFVTDAVTGAGGNSCPPMVVGVGVGGTIDAACLTAKKAHLRPIGTHHPDERYAQLEKDLLEKINASGIGPQGFGGLHTALWVAVEHQPCHIASMPVAVNINCHVARRSSVVLC